jgi:hypothetical protein
MLSCGDSMLEGAAAIFTKVHPDLRAGTQSRRAELRDAEYRTRTADTVCMAKKEGVDIFVRRGAVRRFDALVRKTADLAVEVAWDRRQGDRRESQEPAAVESRKSERRKKQPFTWDAADFVVVETKTGE